MNMDQPVLTTTMGDREDPAGADQERQVLAEIDPDPGSLVALDAKPADVDAGDVLLQRIVLTTEGEDVDCMASTDERLGLAADPRILVVIRMDDHCDRSALPIRELASSRGVDRPFG